MLNFANTCNSGNVVTHILSNGIFAVKEKAEVVLFLWKQEVSFKQRDIFMCVLVPSTGTSAKQRIWRPTKTVEREGFIFGVKDLALQVPIAQRTRKLREIMQQN
jgi:hypothetical protein